MQLLRDRHVHSAHCQLRKVGFLTRICFIRPYSIGLAYRVCAIKSGEVNVNIEGRVESDLTEVCLEVLDRLHQHNTGLRRYILVPPLGNAEVRYAHIQVYGIVP